jgi:hypothetical protein
MRTDRELLELAAKAAGVQGLTWRNGSSCFYYDDIDTGREEWNPLFDDGQALRLAVKPWIRIEEAVYQHCEFNLCDYDDPLAATRRAIVSAAAEIGAQVAAQQNGESDG